MTHVDEDFIPSRSVRAYVDGHDLAQDDASRTSLVTTHAVVSKPDQHRLAGGTKKEVRHGMPLFIVKVELEIVAKDRDEAKQHIADLVANSGDLNIWHSSTDWLYPED